MRDFNADHFFATIPELNAGMKARDFTAVDLAEAFGDRLETLGPKYNALALSLRKPAIKSAKDVRGDMKRERYRGPLQGIPFGAKDLLAVKGYPTTWGAKPYAAQVFDYTAKAVRELEDTGGLLMGKLAMVELAGGGGYRLASASLQGPGLNPWDPSRWSGGSSSGSAIAVAAGLVTYALGSETSGSILTPSAFCGVTGFRPTYGLVSRSGAMPLSWSMDKIGVLGRSVEDCALVLQQISGGDDDDPGSAGKKFYYAPQFARAMKDIVIGYAPVDFAEWAEPAARPDFQRALEQIKSLGVEVRETQLPDFPYGALANTIITADGASVFEELIRSGRVKELADPHQIAGLESGLEIRANEYLKAQRIRSMVKQALRELFIDIDVLVTPSRFGPAPKVSEPLDRPPAAGPRPQDRGLSSLIPAGNLAGLPAISLPCGFADGLPLGISLVARPFNETMLVAIGREFQAHTDWHRRRPPVMA